MQCCVTNTSLNSDHSPSAVWVVRLLCTFTLYLALATCSVAPVSVAVTVYLSLLIVTVIKLQLGGGSFADLNL